VIAIVVVIVYMIASYGIFGVFASLSLGHGDHPDRGPLSLLGATLTLPGLAGIVLIIGRAVDRQRAGLRAHPRGASTCPQPFGCDQQGVPDGELGHRGRHT
jgi:hypothetical protein